MAKGGRRLRCSEARTADAAAVGDRMSVDDSLDLEAGRDPDMWGLFLIHSQDWSLRHIRGWSLGRNQGGVPVVADWHPEVPGRAGLGRAAAVGETVASRWVALEEHGLLHDHIHIQDQLLARRQHQPLEGLGAEHWCPQPAEAGRKIQEVDLRERAGKHLGDHGL